MALLIPRHGPPFLFVARHIDNDRQALRVVRCGLMLALRPFPRSYVGCASTLIIGGGTPMSDAQKETIIIVHGTWAAPESGKCKWYEPPNERPNLTPFVAKLDAALAERGSPARCWAHCSDEREDKTDFTCWSGQNAWIDRAQAATQLANSIDRLEAQGWRVHIVAHSHGGNVALEALPQTKGGTGSFADFSGTLTTLGTPFIDAMSPIAKHLNFRRRTAETVAWTFYVLVCLLGVFGLWVAYMNDVRFTTLKDSWLLFLVIGILSIGPFSLLHARRRGGWSAYWSVPRETSALRPFLLAISSSMDEAWQLLHHLRSMDSPIAPRSGLLGYLLTRRREYLKRSRDIERVHGAALFVLQSRSTKIVAVIFQLILALLVVALMSLAFTAPDERLGITEFRAFLVEQGISDPELEELYKENERLFRNRHDSSDDEWLKHYALLQNAVAEKIKQLPPDQQQKFQDVRRAGHTMVVAVSFGVVAFLWFGLVSVATFFFGRSFYSVVWAPIRWMGRHGRALAGVPSYIVTYIVRRNAWRLLQELAMGLEGYRFALPAIARTPPFAPEYCYKCEDLPKEAEQRALSLRNAWISHHFGDVAQTFSKMVVTASDLSSLLRLVEADQSLVHAAYYTDAECIALIADWIIGTGAQRRPGSGAFPEKVESEFSPIA
jgi:hypothetical protein